MVHIPLKKPLNSVKYRLLSPYSGRHRMKSEMAAYPLQMQLILRHIVMSDDGKLLFVQNPKAGCSSVSHLIYEYSHGSRFQGNIHIKDSKLGSELQLWKRAQSALEDPDVYKFTFVRDPMARALSAFKNFFVEKSNSNYPKYARAIKGFGFRDSDSDAGNFDAYLNLVEASFARSADLTDPHFRAQVKNIGFGALRYDHIGKLESYQADIEHVFERAGLAVPTSLRSMTIKANATKSVSFEPNEQQSARVREIYRADYEAFGY